MPAWSGLAARTERAPRSTAPTVAPPLGPVAGRVASRRSRRLSAVQRIGRPTSEGSRRTWPLPGLATPDARPSTPPAVLVVSEQRHIERDSQTRGLPGPLSLAARPRAVE